MAGAAMGPGASGVSCHSGDSGRKRKTGEVVVVVVIVPGVPSTSSANFERPGVRVAFMCRGILLPPESLSQIILPRYIALVNILL